MTSHTTSDGREAVCLQIVPADEWMAALVQLQKGGEWYCLAKVPAFVYAESAEVRELLEQLAKATCKAVIEICSDGGATVNTEQPEQAAPSTTTHH